MLRPKQFIRFCMIIWMLFSFSISNVAAQTNFWAYPMDRQTIRQSLAKIQALDRYQVNYLVKNLNTGEYLLTGQALVDQNEAALDLKVDFYPTLQESSLTELRQQAFGFHLLSYNNLQNNYLSLNSLLDPSFIEDYLYQDLSATYSLDQTLVQIPSQGNSEIMFSQLTPSIQLLPTTEQVLEFSPYQILKADRRLAVRSQRLGIPVGILNFDQSLSFYQRVDYLLSESPNEQTHLNLEANLEWQTQRSFISWALQMNGRLNQLQAVDQVGHSLYQYQSKTISDKLTQYNFIIDPEALTYQAEFVGLVENFDLNIFDHETAKYRANNYQLSVQVGPTDKEIPAEASLNALSLENLNNQLGQ